MIWVILLASAVGVVVFVERVLHYHRAHINSVEFLNGVRESLEEAGLVEVPPLEDKLNLLATIAQIAPLMGLLGTVLGFIKIFTVLQTKTTIPTMQDLSGGVWQALICTAAGLAVAIPAYAAYNYLVSRVNAIVLDMEKAATEITNILADTLGRKGS